MYNVYSRCTRVYTYTASSRVSKWVREAARRRACAERAHTVGYFPNIIKLSGSPPEPTRCNPCNKQNAYLMVVRLIVCLHLVQTQIHNLRLDKCVTTYNKWNSKESHQLQNCYKLITPDTVDKTCYLAYHFQLSCCNSLWLNAPSYCSEHLERKTRQLIWVRISCWVYWMIWETYIRHRRTFPFLILIWAIYMI